MRLKFVKGKQKELLRKEKDKLNLSWPQFADHLRMKYGKLWSFVNEIALIDEETFDKLKLNKDYKRYIIARLGDNWGRSKGGEKSKGNTKKIKIPVKDEELAELWGIILGDGHIQKRKSYKIGVYSVKIAGHSSDDREYLSNFVKPLIEKLFYVKSRFEFSKLKKCMYVIVDSRKIVDFFEENGFKAGNKIANQSTIPEWIKENQKFLVACLRGLLDTDGSFYRLTNQNSYQICFVNHSIAS